MIKGEQLVVIIVICDKHSDPINKEISGKSYRRQWHLSNDDSTNKTIAMASKSCTDRKSMHRISATAKSNCYCGDEKVSNTEVYKS